LVLRLPRIPQVKPCIQCHGPYPHLCTSELLVYAYMAQCRCDPANTPEYFTAFYNIIQAMQDFRQDTPPDLQRVVMEERARYRYTHQELETAIKCLGFGNDGPLSIEFDDEVSDEFIANAWRDKVRRAWRDPKDGGQIQRDANDSFRIVAEERGSTMLRKLWEENNGRTMNPDRAYSTLEIPTDVDDDMVLTVFSLRVCFSFLPIYCLNFLIFLARLTNNQASVIKCGRRCLSLLS
jgi:ubiquitin carboxyl-terminal hydrolase 25/28